MPKYEYVRGRLVRLQPNGFGVVRLDDGKEAFFDRFAPRASKLKGGLKVGSRVQGEATPSDDNVMHMVSVSLE
jgi:hypothetical protein